MESSVDPDPPVARVTKRSWPLCLPCRVAAEQSARSRGIFRPREGCIAGCVYYSLDAPLGTDILDREPTRW